MTAPSEKQLRFGVRKGKTPKAKFKIGKTPQEAIEPDAPYYLEGPDSLTNVTRSFFEVENSFPDILTGPLAIGSAVGELAMVAKIIYVERDWYCADEKLHPDKSVRGILPGVIPTTGAYHKFLRLLEKHRPSFQTSEESHRPFERGEIKKKLYDVWNEIADNFDLRTLFHQSTIMNKNEILLPSGKTATSQDVATIARRIIEKKFEKLVVNDPDYYGIHQPTFAFKMNIGNRVRHLIVRPDEIEVLKPNQATTREKVRKGQIVTKIIVGDFKDSKRELFEDPNSPIARTIRLTRLVNEQIARKFDWSLLIKDARTHGWSRETQRVFLITSDTPDSFPPEQTETKFICLDEEGEDIDLPMPKLTKAERDLAIQDLRGYFENAA